MTVYEQKYGPWGTLLCVIMHAYAKHSVFLIWASVGVLDMGSAHIGNQGDWASRGRPTRKKLRGKWKLHESRQQSEDC